MFKTGYDKQFFAEVYDDHPQAVIWFRPVWDENGDTIVDFEFTYTNDEGLKYLNLERQHFGGSTLKNSATLTDELRSRIFGEMQAVFESGIKCTSNIFNPALNKYARVLRMRMREGVLTIIQDITEENKVIRQLEEQKKQLEIQKVQLEEQKTLLNNILDRSSNGISVSRVFRDENGVVVDALTTLSNDAAVGYIGLPREIYLTKRATELEPEVIGSPYYQMCIRTLSTGEPFVSQYYMNSTNRWLELTVSKMDNDHLIQIFTDVTPIKKAQLELEKAAATLKTVFDSAQTGMFTIKPEYDHHGVLVDFRFVMVNSTIGTYVNQPAEAMVGHLASKWFPGYFAAGVFEMYKHTFQTGESQRKEVHYDVEGFDNYLDLQSVRIDDQVLVSFTDHTSLRKSQLELEESVKALKRSNSYLEDFAHVASHDLKEPLRKILTFNDRLRGSLINQVGEDERRFFDRIKSSAERMQLLVDDLLEFSSMKKEPDMLESIDLKQKLNNVLGDLELDIEERKAQVILGDLPTVRGNRRQLQQLFQNLIGNALKYSKPDVPPVISISSRQVEGSDLEHEISKDQSEKNFHLITISDNGIGFDPYYSEKIFDIFQRLHKKSEYSGTGIGLSIARKVVENHGGYIWAEGKPGVGATFNILFPAGQNESK